MFIIINQVVLVDLSQRDFYDSEFNNHIAYTNSFNKIISKPYPIKTSNWPQTVRYIYSSTDSWRRFLVKSFQQHMKVNVE